MEIPLSSLLNDSDLLWEVLDLDDFEFSTGVRQKVARKWLQNQSDNKVRTLEPWLLVVVVL